MADDESSSSSPLTLRDDLLSLVRDALALRADSPEPAPAEAGDEELPFEEYHRAGEPAVIFHRPVSVGDTSKRTLFAHHVWNGARAASAYFEEHPELVRGRSVLEFGAGSGLPSLVAVALGARFVAVTDYPSPELVAAMQGNLERNGMADPARAVALGYLWGSDAAPVLTANGGAGYDVLVLADCMWNHPLHQALVDSVAATLRQSPDAMALVTFSHHIPGLESAAKDLGFFRLAAEAGLQQRALGHYQYKPIMEEKGVESQTVFCVGLFWTASG
eukprot:c46020_g1_i1.p1 GENE.c46020_g1_i1~~c46020_g1_i1.p1  ORF type:complete len:290 (-),score=39.76 c46020_g1_i1:258-1082(-)